MAVDKLVDSTQLDADLTSVANTIRTKGGTSAPLAFPAGFVNAINAIPTGGGGGGGDYQIAGGSFTLVQANTSAYVDVDFEPTHAICFRPISDFAEITSWTLYSITIPDTSENKYIVVSARTVSGNPSGNATLRDTTNIEYSDGQFKFNANYNFLTGITYYWYCWRENI